DASGFDAQHMRQARDDLVGLAVEGEQRLQARVWPQPEFTWRRFQDRIVALVGVRHRNRAEFQAGFLDALGIEPFESQCERNLRQGLLPESTATSARDGAPGSGCP